MLLDCVSTHTHTHTRVHTFQLPAMERSERWSLQSRPPLCCLSITHPLTHSLWRWRGDGRKARLPPDCNESEREMDVLGAVGDSHCVPERLFPATPSGHLQLLNSRLFHSFRLQFHFIHFCSGFFDSWWGSVLPLCSWCLLAERQSVSILSPLFRSLFSLVEETSLSLLKVN